MVSNELIVGGVASAPESGTEAANALPAGRAAARIVRFWIHTATALPFGAIATFGMSSVLLAGAPEIVDAPPNVVPPGGRNVARTTWFAPARLRQTTTAPPSSDTATLGFSAPSAVSESTCDAPKAAAPGGL